jgi:RNA polymerase primary sigma factor
LANQNKTIRLPVHLVDKISKMRRVSLQMNEELGREPTDDELAEETELKTIRVLLKTAEISLPEIATRFGVSRATLYRSKVT